MRTKPGENEGRFAELVRSKAPEVTLCGKRRFKVDGVETSVDESLLYGGKHYLIEIDSGNVAKMLVGQYILLNHLSGQSLTNPFFLVVHTHKSYNISRTLKNLDFVDRNILGGKGMPFGAVHLSSLSNWTGGMPGFLELVREAGPATTTTET